MLEEGSECLTLEPARRSTVVGMDTMRISQVAARSGVPATTLRYYGELGLLHPERATNGYRVYEPEVLDRLQFIRAATQVNLPLEEVAELVHVWESDPCATVKGRLRPLLEEQLARVHEGLAEMSQVQRDLDGALRHLDELPDRSERCDPGCAFLATSREPEPVACTLGGAARREQVADWRRLVEGAPLTRTAHGVRVELSTADLTTAASLAAAEQECCPFLGFEITLHGGAFTLAISAPTEGLAMIDELIGDVHAAVPAR